MPVTPLTGLRRVTFRRRALIPPTASYITTDDWFTITVTTLEPRVNYSLRIRMLLPSGEVREYTEERSAGTIFGSPAAIRIPLAEGFLLSAAVSTTGGFANEGKIWVVVGIRTGSVTEVAPARVLIRGWLQERKPLGWPEGPLESAQVDHGSLFVARPADPAPGSNLVYPMDVGYRARILAIHFRFLTDANVANRTIRAVVYDSIQEMFFVEVDRLHPAGTLRYYDFLPGLGTYDTAGTRIMVPFPTGILLQFGNSIQTAIANRQVGDQIDRVAIFMERWMIL